MLNSSQWIIAGVTTLAMIIVPATAASAAKQSKSSSTPYGALTSNVWRTNGNGATSGNTRQWNYQVTAKVAGTQRVAQIKTTWTGGASLRNSANFSVTAGRDTVSVGGGSSWQYVSQTKYFNNTNGARLSTYASNMIATPKKDYRSGTIGLVNTALVKFRGDARNWQISASV